MPVLQYLDGDGDDYGGDCGDDGAVRRGDNDGAYGGGGDPTWNANSWYGMAIALLAVSADLAVVQRAIIVSFAEILVIAISHAAMCHT